MCSVLVIWIAQRSNNDILLFRITPNESNWACCVIYPTKAHHIFYLTLNMDDMQRLCVLGRLISISLQLQIDFSFWFVLLASRYLTLFHFSPPVQPLQPSHLFNGRNAIGEIDDDFVWALFTSVAPPLFISIINMPYICRILFCQCSSYWYCCVCVCCPFLLHPCIVTVVFVFVFEFLASTQFGYTFLHVHR